MPKCVSNRVLACVGILYLSNGRFIFRPQTPKCNGGDKKPARLAATGHITDFEKEYAMNKKLIAVVLAALPVVAMADVTLYGAIKGDVESNSITNGKSQGAVQDDTSVVGFKGTEDLGNGLKTVWQVENRVHVDGSGSSDTFGSRQTFVGLDGGNLGLVRLGYVNNFMNDQDSVDQWQYASTVGTSGANGLGIFTNSGDRIKNAIRYDSATFAGFSAGIEYGFGENATNSGDTPATKNGNGTANKSSSIIGVGLNYSYNDALAAHYSLQRENNPLAAYKSADSTSVTAQSNNGQAATKQVFEIDYSANNLFVSGAYQWSTGYDWADDFSGDGVSNSNLATSTAYSSTLTNAGLQLKARQAALSVAYTIGAFTPKATYAKGWDLKANNSTIADSGYRQYVFGVDYALSKRTTAGVSYGNVNYGKGTSVAASDGATSSVTLKTVALTLAHSF